MRYFFPIEEKNSAIMILKRNEPLAAPGLDGLIKLNHHKHKRIMGGLLIQFFFLGKEFHYESQIISKKI